MGAGPPPWIARRTRALLAARADFGMAQSHGSTHAAACPKHHAPRREKLARAICDGTALGFGRIRALVQCHAQSVVSTRAGHRRTTRLYALKKSPAQSWAWFEFQSNSASREISRSLTRSFSPSGISGARGGPP